MSWIKIDDQFSDHPKIRAVGSFGAALQVSAFCYCGKYLTDGFLSFSVVQSLVQALASDFLMNDGKIWTPAFTCGMTGNNARELNWPQIMVDARLWDETEGGYLVHDYLIYNPSKTEVLELRNKRSEAGKIGGERSKPPSKSLSKNEASAQANKKQIAKQNRSKTEPPTPTPTPKRREEEEAAEKVLAEYNSLAEKAGLTKVLKLSPQREAHVQARLSEPEFDWPTIQDKIIASDFARGKNDRQWKIDFEFIFESRNNYLKILEGKYDNKGDNPETPEKPPVAWVGCPQNKPTCNCGGKIHEPLTGEEIDSDAFLSKGTK